MLLLQFLLAALTSIHIQALAPANPHGWDEYQPDGSKAGKLYLKGHPYDEKSVYVVDKHEHPVVRNDDGWFVYGTPLVNSTEAKRHRKLWEPTPYRVGPNTRPPRHLQERLLSQTDSSFEPPSLRLDSMDLQCVNEEKSQWCPNGELRISRTLDHPLNFGTTRVIVVLVKFKDHASRPMPPRQYYDVLFNSGLKDAEITPTGSVDEFMRLQSLNQYRIKADVQEWSQASESEEYYSFGMFGLTSLYTKIAYDALDRMDRQGTDWSQYDRDGDGMLDSVVILHSGFAAEGGGTDCINNRELGPHRIWSHRTSVSDNRDAWRSSDENYHIGRYATASAVHGFCGNDIARIGVVGHEMLHMNGLPDLLGKDSSGVGVYDVMGMMWGLDGTQRYPGTLSPWSRSQLGWINPQRITRSGVYELRASQTNSDCFRIDLRDGEYLLLENRQKQLLDGKLPNDGGILIWHIDENMDQEWMSFPGYPEQGGWPGNGNHFQVALIQADGNYDMEKNTNYGDVTDAWCSGCWESTPLALKPGPARGQALAGSYDRYPNTDTYSNGIIQRTGITIDAFSASGPTMSFRVLFENDAPPPTINPTPRPSLMPTPRPTPNPTPQPIPVSTSRPTDFPTFEPTLNPTEAPTESPSVKPTPNPSSSPTFRPASTPTLPPVPEPTPPTPNPTKSPTLVPTREPTASPSVNPTSWPIPVPTNRRTLQPTGEPSGSPTTKATPIPSAQITMSPTLATASPTASEQITASPTLATRTLAPSVATLAPTVATRTLSPSVATLSPSSSPTWEPTASPIIQQFTMSPTIPDDGQVWTPASAPIIKFSFAEFHREATNPPVPYQGITMSPTVELITSSPSSRSNTTPAPALKTLSPTEIPTDSPTNVPTVKPSASPSSSPSYAPSAKPSASPTASQQPTLSLQPSEAPTDSWSPSASPTGPPTNSPTKSPTDNPTAVPSENPTSPPTTSPQPSNSPTKEPTASPTDIPTNSPTQSPTGSPSTRVPTASPSDLPTAEPTVSPTFSPTEKPTRSPTPAPTPQPSPEPIRSPTSEPTSGDTLRTHSPTAEWSDLDAAAGGFAGETYVRRPYFYIDEQSRR